MNKRKFEIINKANEKLICIEVLPPNSTGKQFPVVILCHGYGYFKEEDGIFTEIAQRLSKAGYAVYYFDFSGCGESEGDYSQTTLTKLVGDLKSVVKSVAAYDYIDENELSLISHSYGSNVVIAAQILGVKRIAMSGSFANAFQVLSNLFNDFNENGISTRDSTNKRARTIGPQFWKNIKSYDIPALIKNFDCPILFIHGKLDKIVPIENMQPLFEATTNPIGPIILQKSDHDLSPEREVAFRSIVDFFAL